MSISTRSTAAFIGLPTQRAEGRGQKAALAERPRRVENCSNCSNCMPRLIGNIESKGAVRAGGEGGGRSRSSLFTVCHSTQFGARVAVNHFDGLPLLSTPVRVTTPPPSTPLAPPANAFLRLLMCPFFPLGDTLVKPRTYIDYIPIIYSIYLRTYMVYGIWYKVYGIWYARCVIRQSA